MKALARTSVQTLLFRSAVRLYFALLRALATLVGYRGDRIWFLLALY